MSLCRFSSDSDVYVYSVGGNAYTCCGCKLGQDTIFAAKGMIEHLKLHKAIGDKVPDSVFTALEAENGNGSISR